VHVCSCSSPRHTSPLHVLHSQFMIHRKFMKHRELSDMQSCFRGRMANSHCRYVLCSEVWIYMLMTSKCAYMYTRPPGTLSASRDPCQTIPPLQQRPYAPWDGECCDRAETCVKSFSLQQRPYAPVYLCPATFAPLWLQLARQPPAPVIQPSA
jgi:hypothetical protein